MLTSRRNSKKRFKIRYFTHLVSHLIRITDSFYLLRLQIDAMMALPPFAIGDFWSAFTAFHIIQLSSSLLTLSHDTQPQTLSTLIQILSLLPDPKEGPYFRRFLRHPTQPRGVPTCVAAAFVRGVAWKRPSGPGHICSLLIHCLFWADTSLGDDGKASIDAEVRKALARKLDLMVKNDGFKQIDQFQRVEIDRLHGILRAIDGMPGDTYLKSTRQYLEGQLEICENKNCAEEAQMTCSRCKTVRYCGKPHQAHHWKNGHKLRCFPPIVT
jgi:hypothetical protein